MPLFRDPKYRGEDFTVRIESDIREICWLVIDRNGFERKLEGERIGKRWQGIGVHLPLQVDPADVPQIVRDVETALSALRIGYVITRTVGRDAVPETEQQAAVAELNEMGFDVERSPDLKQITTSWKPGARRPDNAKGAKEFAQRMQRLIGSLRESRPRVELLAKSKEFADDYEDYIPR